MKYGNRSPWKRYISSPLALVFLLIIAGILARASFNINQKSALSASRLAQAQAEFQKLKERQTDLTEKVGRLSSEDGLESEIRAKYRAVKEGESVAVIIDESATTTPNATSTYQAAWWKRVLRRIGIGR
jgi:cell division protein FtsB